jgi:hypothetical protein
MLFIYLVFFVFPKYKCDVSSKWLNHSISISYQESKLLDDILLNYNTAQRPERRPTPIFVDIYVRSMSKISELDMEYSFGILF